MRFKDFECHIYTCRTMNNLIPDHGGICSFGFKTVSATPTLNLLKFFYNSLSIFSAHIERLRTISNRFTMAARGACDTILQYQFNIRAWIKMFDFPLN